MLQVGLTCTAIVLVFSVPLTPQIVSAAWESPLRAWFDPFATGFGLIVLAGIAFTKSINLSPQAQQVAFARPLGWTCLAAFVAGCIVQTLLF